MKIVLMSVGTRGDMEPFLAIGELLKERGQRVICAFPEQFRGLAEDSGMDFFSLGEEFLQMLDSDLGKTAIGGSGSGLQKFIAYVKLARRFRVINRGLVTRQKELVDREKPDRIVYSGKCVYPVMWGLENIGRNILISPVPYMHYVRDHPHVGFGGNYGTFFNRLSYKIANFGLVSTIMSSVKTLKIERRITRDEIKRAISSNKVVYTISPALFPRPGYWGKNLKVLGFYERDKTVNWEPGDSLKRFIAEHDKILFITFGSMTNPDPEERTGIILDILQKNTIPAIINTSSGGLSKPAEYDRELIHFVNQIPYDWIFPKVYAAVHHGGSGTTQTALKYGCATMIIPHIIDQFAWNDIVSGLGCGPKGIKASKLTKENLEPLILDLIQNRSYKTRALEISNEMGKESFRERLYETIIE